MGMAASQARLLCITARIHDVEYQAQSIQNAKLQLGIQSDRIHDEYMAALDEQSLVLTAIDTKSGTSSQVAATFNNLCSRNKLTPAGQGVLYALRDARGRLIVEDEIAKGYNTYKSSCVGNPSAEAFALFMIEGTGGALGAEEQLNERVQLAEEAAWETLNNEENTSIATERLKGLHQQLEEMVGEGKSIYAGPQNSEDKEDYEKALAAYRTELYKTAMEEMVNSLKNIGNINYLDAQDEEVMGDFDYYAGDPGK